MGVRFPTAASTTFVGPLPANANETVVLTTPPINEPIDNAQVVLLWFFSYTGGTANTSAKFQIRRGTTAAGTVLNAGVWQLNIAAGVNEIFTGLYVDSPGVVAGQQYSLTLQQIAATGAGTFMDGCMLAMVL